MTPELLFCNLPSILHAHQLFWQEVIYPMLQEVRRTGDPFDPVRLEAGCLQVRVQCLQDTLQQKKSPEHLCHISLNMPLAVYLGGFRFQYLIMSMMCSSQMHFKSIWKMNEM